MGSNLVIVAIPAADDLIWKISSEKVPHLTLLFLGESKGNPKVNEIFKFVSHAVNVCEHGSFYMNVDRRDVLGEDRADVIHFRKEWDAKWIKQFRNQLLQHSDIRTAYDSTDQFPEWQPHLTLGYPETPAHDDKIPEYGLSSVRFDRIAVWTGNYEGPEFRLEWPDREEELVVAYGEIGKTIVEKLLCVDEIKPSESMESGLVQTGIHGEAFVDTLVHFGIKGMRWGQRKAPPMPVAPQATSRVPQGAKRKTKIDTEGGENHPASEDAIKVAQAKAKLKKSGPAALTNKELQEVANRVELEQRVRRAVEPTGKKFVTNVLKNQGNQEANKFVNRQVKKQFAMS
jgi:2'-5' RNA ligase